MKDDLDELLDDTDIDYDDLVDISGDDIQSIVDNIELLDEGSSEEEEDTNDSEDIDSLINRAYGEAYGDTQEESNGDNELPMETNDSYEVDPNIIENINGELLEEDQEKMTPKKAFDKLFKNIEDEEYDKKLREEEQRKEEKKAADAEKKKEAEEQKKIHAEEKKKEAEEQKAVKKAEAEKKKANKLDIKKKKEEEKKKKKEAAAKEDENEPIGRINKLGAVVVFLFVGLILVAIIGYASSISNIDYARMAKNLMVQGDYEQAYIQLLKDEDNNKDTKLYNQLKLLQSLNKQLSYYSSFIIAEDREKALDALVVAVSKYDDNKSEAKKLGIDSEYEDIFLDVKKYLKSEYDISVEKARNIAKLKNETEYSEKIKNVCLESKKK